MTIKTFSEYQKAITVGAGGTSKVGELMVSVLAESKLLSALRPVPMDGKTTFIPFLKTPNDSSTTYTIGSLNMDKVLLKSVAKLTDETAEDAAINMEEALDYAIATQARLKFEDYVAEFLTGFPDAIVAQPRTFDALLAVMQTFPYPILGLKSPILACMSWPTYIAILGSMTSAHRDIVDQGYLKLIPLAGMDDNNLVLCSPEGFSFGGTIYDVEKDRQPSMGLTNLITQLAVSAAADPAYIKNIPLT